MRTQLLVGDVFARAAASHPNRVAVTLGDDALSFGELQRRAIGRADSLRRLGVRRGDRIGVWADTSLEMVVQHAACAQLGAAFVPLDPGAPQGSARSAVQRIGMDHLIVDRTHAEPGRELAGGGVVVTTFEHLAEIGADRTTEDLDGPGELDPQAVFLTSGSTGEPKGVVLSHRTQWIRSTSGALPEPRGVTVSMFPLFHMAGWIVAMQCWQARAPVALVARADADSILDAVQRHAASRLYAIPAVWIRILAADPDGGRGRSLRVVDTGTSATPPELLAALAERYPKARRRVFYGSTEAGPVLMLDSDELDLHPATVGRPQPGVEVRLSPEGELEVRGVHLFSGYLDGPDQPVDPALTEDGWFRTGDMAECSDDGLWSITGRLRQVIRTGGETVSPREVETVLDAVEGVAESAVIGLPDPEWGEVVVAIVVADDPRADRREFEISVREACERALPGPRRPRRYEFALSLPRTTATGQVRRSLLAERLASGLPADGTDT